MTAIESEIVEQIEAHLYLQIIDTAWKDHLLAMDHLKDAVSLRGYAQRDPLQEYKKEAFNLFNSMWARIQDDTVHLLTRMPQPRLEMQPSARETEEEELEEMDDRQLTMHHPSPDQNQESQAAIQTFRRDSEKIGRNSACPCGSGKKYKKCCGRPGSGVQL